MKKNLDLFVVSALMLIIPLNANAVKYFFTPGGAGEKDGSSWTNAAEGEILGVSLSSFASGDEIYLTEGSYYPDLEKNFWTIPQGLTIKGGFKKGLTGSSTDITYPTVFETIFTADYDGDGDGDNGAVGFIQIKNPNASPSDTKDNFNKVTISGITISKSYYTGANYGGGALFIKHANVELNWVKFINNTTTARGGAGLTAWGSFVTCKDCIFKDNYVPGNSGAAWLIRQYNSGTSNTQTNRSIAVFERCEFTNNTTDAGSSSAYGGGAAMADYAGDLYMANCTFSGSKALRSGGALRISGGVNFYCISSTFFNNYTNNGSSNGEGDAISAGTGANTYFANTIFVNDIDTYDTNKALLFFQTGTTKAYSAGYNVWGTINDSGNNGANFQSSDKISTAENIYTKAAVLGTNNLTNNGGWSQTIVPAMNVSGMQTSELQALVSTWNLPGSIDLTVDQRGYKRAATTMAGAIDMNAIVASIPKAVAVSSPKIYTLKDGLYIISGVTGKANVYDLNGKSVMNSFQVSEGNSINLNALSKGIYIIRINGESMKIVR